MAHKDEDMIIVSGLMEIKRGIEEQDWQVVCDGYKIITGEEIKPVEVKLSQVERVRKLMNEQKPSSKKVNKKQPDVEDDDVDDGTLSVITQKGGTRFGSGKLQIITDKEDENEAEKNAQLVKKRIKMPKRSKYTGPIKTKYTEESPFRIKDELPKSVDKDQTGV